MDSNKDIDIDIYSDKFLHKFNSDLHGIAMTLTNVKEAIDSDPDFCANVLPLAVDRAEKVIESWTLILSELRRRKF